MQNKSGKDGAAGARQGNTAQQGKKYPTGKLLGSRHLAGYQRDFARVILTEPEYTIAGAKASLDKALKRK